MIETTNANVINPTTTVDINAAVAERLTKKAWHLEQIAEIDKQFASLRGLLPTARKPRVNTVTKTATKTTTK